MSDVLNVTPVPIFPSTLYCMDLHNDISEFFNSIIDNIDFDQLILEFHNPEEPNSGWIHSSYKNKEENRKQVLRAYRNDDGKTVYEPYDPS